MNANYVYSMPVAIAIEQKADENIAKIIKSGSGYGKFIFRLILLLSVAGLITILSYNYLSIQQVPANPQNTNAIAPLSVKDREKNNNIEEDKPEPVTYKTRIFYHENSDSSENITDSIKDIASTPIINSENSAPKTKSDRNNFV